MEGISREDLERLVFFEQAKDQAIIDYQKNNKDTQALTRWGGALLELAHFRQGNEAVQMIEEAVEKFLMALEINPKKHEALWCLGNAYTSQGFLYAEASRAQEHFDQAAECFQKALAEDPTSEVYKKALEMTAKAPALHMELQRQLAQQSALQQISSANEVPAGNVSGKGTEGSYDFLYDLAGWGILGLITTAWILMARNQAKASAV